MGDDGKRRPALTLYGRSWCHLCDDMLTGLQSLQARFSFDVVVIDVDTDPALEALYGERIPVLAHDGRELCHYRLDSAAVTEYLLDFR